MKAPEVSVVIPAYNAEKWLSVAVESVISQTFTDWELIIVNDGSTDNTLQVAKRYTDERIRVVEQANAGVSAARNAGMLVAAGRYIRFLDADDGITPDNLLLMVTCLKTHQVDWTYGDLVFCDDQLIPTGRISKGTREHVLRKLLINMEPPVPGAGSNLLVHKRCFLHGVRFDEKLSNAADQDFTMQLAAQFSHHYTPDARTLYRNMPDSMSKNIQRYQLDHLRLFENAKQRGLLENRRFRKRCMANVYWAIGGSWWLLAHQPFRGLPFMIRAFLLWPKVVLRPIRNRIVHGASNNAGGLEQLP